ncbi:LysE/ArgO family amino acid transporter [Paraglaciecola aquimarina]|uniref:LysE/ArgO family amino acid transporter n=1 Tax=Paraglaciecola algarum TaxID=3050085 RepID=A0ABS9D4X9_9ALTE|nr:LysE/ArgO family amino acid transporter [Paraglaciecola sp. G1-23]MCF2947719.1 LysE/ArgO family amino acid transporter [Paraglaciecola sp. G1-23]
MCNSPKQGIKKQHVFLVCLLCAASDAILISLGVSGFAAVVDRYPWVEPLSKIGGAVFLYVYAFKSFYSAYVNNHGLDPATQTSVSAFKTAMICLAFTWLNPHVYLDTFVLLGSISTQFTGSKLEFTLGAVIASFVFFFSLGYGARMLTPIFHKPISWKILEAFVGILMLVLATSLIMA